MSILVGTLNSGETQFAECIAGIRRQVDCDYHHFVIAGLKKRPAHIALYRKFMEKRNDYSIFLKVDADMIIENPNLFVEIETKFKSIPSLQNLQIAVHDFFSDQLIGAMHAYRGDVSWPEQIDDVFTDLPPVPEDRILFDDSELAPAAVHCKDPSPFQAFHYGVNRGVKAVVAAQRGNSNRVKFYIKNNEHVWQNFRGKRDRRLALAVIGMELALAGVFRNEHVDYSEIKTKDTFRKYEAIGVEDLELIIKKFFLQNRRLTLPEISSD